MSGSTLPPSVSRRLSRSNSTSSSVATVKHMGAKIGHRKSSSQARPISSDSINQHFSTLDAAAAAAASHSRPDTAQDRVLSPNLNINRWSHSTSSSMGAIEGEFMRQIPGNPASSKTSRPDPANKQPMVPKSQYARQPSESSVLTASPRKSPGRQPRLSRKSSSEGMRNNYVNQPGPGHDSNLATTPDLDTTVSRSNNNEYFGTTVLDHSRGPNKYGQQVEGIALQFTAGHSRQRRSDQNKLGNGLYQATNSSHISLQKKPSHNRRKERSENGSRDTAAGGSISSIRSEYGRRGGHRSPTQKNMLSQALAKANQAVLLDNAQNIQGAIEAYVEACDILEQVMVRSSDNEDRKKLSAIRGTYSTRIAELYDLDNTFDHLATDKELPEAPATTRYLDGEDRISFEDPDDLQPPIFLNEPPGQMQIPLRQESLLPQIFGGERYIEQQPPSRLRPPAFGASQSPMDAQYMPPPLSPRRLPSPSQTDDEPTPVAPLQQSVDPMDDRISSESTSWLDTMDEGNSSNRSSRLSSIDFSRRDNELVSAIEAELDAAVDAAYEDSYEPETTPKPAETTSAPHNTAAQPHTQPSCEGIRSLATQPSQDSITTERRFDYLTREYLDDDAEDEEELLEMLMTEGLLDNQAQRPGAMTSLPRQSDSSGVSARSSGRTWESSLTAATQGTALSTLAESPEMPQYEPPGVPKDTDETTLPAQDVNLFSRKQSSPLPPLPASERLATVPLRDRRLSGQSAKKLKIETFARRPSVNQQGQPAQGPLLEIPSAKAQEKQPELTRSTSGTNISVNTSLASIHSAASIESPGTPNLTQLMSNSTVGDEANSLGQNDSQRMPPPIRKKSSASNLRPRKLSLTTTDLNDLPPTPGSGLFPTHSRTATISTPALPSASPNVLTGAAVGGMYVFEHIADPMSPTSPRSPDYIRLEPAPLEPCPESYLLRPFWLMRCLYQTLAHPKGGYISTKLFVPRDIWRVRATKIKAMDDKAGQCDVLTAALLKLAKVDTLDADAVLEELQTFDGIMDNVRQNLSKKLGNDVGLSGGTVAAMKTSPAEDPEPSGSSKSMKSLASSWKKLRSKSSSTALAPSMPRKDSGAELTMPSLPMTGSSAVTTSRSYKAQRLPPPTPTGIPHIPPQHASYISSLARLFDAVQVLDSIARQVEDPGLKATNKTQVGLELSIRGAAEFFSFYIIRFVLADIGIMMDKYLKRNSEWIML